MGGSSYSDHVYADRIRTAKTTGKDLFAHDADIKSGKASNTVHEKLDPKRLNSFKKLIRESFDSDAQPDSVPVAVIFDVTGSMNTVPRTFVSKLDKLMASLIKKGFLAHPHVLFGAVGDATCDAVPLQIGQFESGNEMDDALTNIVLEGGGGGQTTESYELALYFMARHTDLHAYTKRGKKGYLFITGDERPYPKVKRKEVERLIGVTLQEDIPTEAILAEAQEKFEVFWIMPSGTSHWHDDSVINPLKQLFGQNFLRLENPDDIVELICTTIGVTEGFDLKAVGDALVDIGADKAAVARASKSLVPYANSKAVATVGKVSGSLAKGSKVASATRL